MVEQLGRDVGDDLPHGKLGRSGRCKRDPRGSRRRSPFSRTYIEGTR